MSSGTPVSNRKSILYHLGVVDDSSDTVSDLSEYPC